MFLYKRFAPTPTASLCYTCSLFRANALMALDVSVTYAREWSDRNNSFSIREALIKTTTMITNGILYVLQAWWVMGDLPSSSRGWIIPASSFYAGFVSSIIYLFIRASHVTLRQGRLTQPARLVLLSYPEAATARDVCWPSLYLARSWLVVKQNTPLVVNQGNRVLFKTSRECVRKIVKNGTRLVIYIS